MCLREWGEDEGRTQTVVDLLKIIGELQTEKQRIDEAIAALERIAANDNRRGRSRWSKKDSDTHGASHTDVPEEESQCKRTPSNSP